MSAHRSDAERRNLHKYLPRSVAIVTFGHVTSPWLADHVVRECFVDDANDIFDLRKILHDPLREDRVTHNQDGSHDRTQVAVMGQSSFSAACINMVGTVFESMSKDADKPVLLFDGCKTGCHRAWVVGETVGSICNAIVDSNNDRVLNAQVFHAASCNSKREVEHMLTQAWKWAMGAWTVIPHTDELFGAKAARSREQSSCSLATLNDFVEDTNAWWVNEVESEDVETIDDEAQHEEPPASDTTIADGPKQTVHELVVARREKRKDYE